MSAPRLLLAAALGTALVATATARPSPFSEVPQSHWSYAALQQVLDSGLVPGYDGPFHGNRDLTRQQFAQVLRETLRGLPDGTALDLAQRTRLRRLAGEYSHELSMLDLSAASVDDLLSGRPLPSSKPTAPMKFEPATAKAPAEKLGGGGGNVSAKNKVKFSGHIRLRPEYNENYDFNSAVADSRDFTLLRTNLVADWTANDTYSAKIEIRDARTFGQERNAAGGIGGNTATNTGALDLFQGYVDYHPAADQEHTLRIGRQAVNLGDQRLVGGLNWANAGRAFDGIRYMTKKWGEANVDILYMTVADLTLNPGGVTARDDQDLYGVYANWKLDEHSLDIYALGFKDRAQLNAVSQNGVAGEQDFWTYGLRAFGPLGESGLDYKLESAFQSGDFSIDSLDASAHALILGYDLDEEKKDRIEFEFNYSPGDEAKFGERGTFQNLFPTNHMHYGIADRISWKNIRALRLSWKHKVQGARNWRLDFWKFDLDDTRDAWYRANGAVVRPGIANPVTPVSRDLGSEIDFRYNWKDASMKHQIGVSRFFGGDYQRDTSATRASDDATFAYYMAIFPF